MTTAVLILALAPIGAVVVLCAAVFFVHWLDNRSQR